MIKVNSSADNSLIIINPHWIISVYSENSQVKIETQRGVVFKVTQTVSQVYDLIIRANYDKGN